MRSIVQIPALAVLLLGSVLPLSASDSWSSDFAASRQKAESEGKSMLLDFTGSDWCSWCHRLSNEVFDQAGFEEAISKNFVLVEVDFPQNKSILSQETIEQNNTLAKQFAIKGYPTILLCDAEGIPYGSTGYRAGGLEPYMEHLNLMVANKSKRDELLKEAKSKSGFEKADLMSRALDEMELSEELTTKFYGDLEKEILSLDTDRKTSLAKRVDTKAHLETFSDKVKKLVDEKKFDEVDSVSEEMMKDPLMTGDALQRVYMIHADAQIAAGNKEAGYATLEKAIAVDPKGQKAELLRKFIDVRRANDAKSSS
ncbi:thioredoxin family protein [Luteolibacter pohnpeiensis]|uniref:Thioredoxin family protein n=1 Tax=Luteolibacter pohnpeiensis TaxID=454153 RepID=A0A934SBW4_9BACT|nr:thioredoxin fold domain-containing protein [Luteolibacter pohnpeiensis]MBK1882453.1 thioredoxin family protein [Luteolibacter pohnpeiensis]